MKWTSLVLYLVLCVMCSSSAGCASGSFTTSHGVKFVFEEREWAQDTVESIIDETWGDLYDQDDEALDGLVVRVQEPLVERYREGEVPVVALGLFNTPTVAHPKGLITLVYMSCIYQSSLTHELTHLMLFLHGDSDGEHQQTELWQAVREYRELDAEVYCK